MKTHDEAVSGPEDIGGQQMTCAQRFVHGRQKLDVSLAEMADRTCISLTFLEAIENGDRSKLPERTFTLGFVRSYAEALELNPGEIAEAFKAEFDEQDIIGPEIDPSLIAKPRSQRPWLVAMTLSISGMLTFGAVSYSDYQFEDRPATAFDAPAKIAASETAATSEPATDIADPGRALIASVTNISLDQITADDDANQGLAQPAADKAAANPIQTETTALRPAPQRAGDIILTAQEDSWVHLSNESGETLWAGVILKGQKKKQQVATTVFVTTGNAGGLSLSYGDSGPQKLGKRGAIVRDLAVTPSMFGEAIASNM